MSRILIDEDRCKGCGLCTLFCPYDLLRISDHLNAKGYRPASCEDPEDKCIACTNCAVMCPDVAIVVYRTPKQREARPETRRSVVLVHSTLEL